MEVYIQQRHINKGKKHSHSHCPIALAVKEKTHRKVFVAGYAIRIKRGLQYTYYALPQKAIDFVKTFDSDPRPFASKPFLLKINS